MMLNFSKMKYLGCKIAKFLLVSYLALFLIGYVFFAVYYHVLSFNLVVATVILLLPIFILYTLIAYWSFKFWRKKNWSGYISLLLAPFLFFWIASFIYFAFRGLSVQCGVNPFERIPETFHIYSLNITDSFLDNEAMMQYLLTIDRFQRKEILAGDFNTNILSCQKKARVNWKNNSMRAVALEGLPGQENIVLQPGKSYSTTFAQEGAYPYLLSNYPKIIHVGQIPSDEPLGKDFLKFCQDNARGEVLVVFWSEIKEEEVADLFVKSGLVLIDQKPYNSYLARPAGEKSLPQILETLKTNAQFGRMDYDCSFPKIETD